MDELVYVDYWRLTTSYFYLLQDGTMFNTGLKALDIAESECVFKRPGADDFTGGYHGDELLNHVSFYSNGLLVDIDSGAIDLTPSNELYYLEKSTMHQTSADGQPVPGHPVEADHVKRTVFSDGGYTTYNRLTWQRAGKVEIWYVGLCCVGKPAAGYVHTNDLFEDVEMTKSNLTYLYSTGAKHNTAYYRGDEFSASVTSNLLSPSDMDGSNLSLSIWDRVGDSKFYRGARNIMSEVGDVWESEMFVKFR